MARSYPHRPDVAFFQDGRPHAARLRPIIERNVAKGFGRVGLADAGVHFGLESAAVAWLLDEPPTVAHDQLSFAGDAAWAAYHHLPRPLPAMSVELWTVAAVLAGQPDRAAALAAMFTRPGEVDLVDPLNPWRAPVPPMIAALVRGDHATAGTQASTLRAGLAAGEVPVVAEAEMTELASLAIALLGTDWPALDSVLRARCARRAELAGRTVESRRRWYYLIDTLGATVAVLAARAGMDLPEDLPAIPVPLLTPAI